MQMMHYDALDRCASTQSVKYQTLTKVRFSKMLSKNRIGKITEIDTSALSAIAEQGQNRQNF